MKTAIFLLFISQFFGIYQLFALNTYPVTMFDLGMIAFYAVAMKRIFWDGETLVFPKTLAMVSIFGIAAASIVSAVNPILGGDPLQQIQFVKTCMHFLYLVLLVILCSGLTIKNTDWKFSIQSLLIAAVGVHLFGMYQLVARALDLPLAWFSINSIAFASRGGYDLASVNQGEVRQLSLNFGSFFRATSIFSEPSSLAAFCMFILTALLVPFLRDARHFIHNHRFNVILTVLTVVSLFLTFSLTAAALFFGLLIFAFATERTKKSLKLLKIIGIITLVIIATNVVVEYATDISVSGLFTQRIGGIVSKYTGGRMETTNGESFFGRLSTIEYALQVWYSYPLTGIGIGCYYSFNKSESHGFSDSGIFSCLAETGFIGFVMFCGVLFSTFYLFKKYILSDDYQKLTQDTKQLAHFSLYNAILMMIASVTSNTFVSSYFWLEIALFYAVLSTAHREIGYPVLRVRVMNIPLKTYFMNIQPVQK